MQGDLAVICRLVSRGLVWLGYLAFTQEIASSNLAATRNVQCACFFFHMTVATSIPPLYGQPRVTHKKCMLRAVSKHCLQKSVFGSRW